MLDLPYLPSVSCVTVFCASSWFYTSNIIAYYTWFIFTLSCPYQYQAVLWAVWSTFDCVYYRASCSFMWRYLLVYFRDEHLIGLTCGCYIEIDVGVLRKHVCLITSVALFASGCIQANSKLTLYHYDPEHLIKSIFSY